MAERIIPPDFLGNISRGLQIGGQLQQRRDRAEDRKFLLQQREEAKANQAQKDFYTGMSHLDPNNIDPNDFKAMGKWYLSRNPDDKSAAQELENLQSATPEELGQYVQQAHNYLGIRPTQKRPDQWQGWGYGQMRNKETGEIEQVPVAPKAGETIRTTPEGGVEIIRGVDVKTGPGLSKPVVRDLTKTIINNENNLSKLDRIENQFVPDFLTFGGKIGAKISSLKSKAGLGVSPRSKEFLGKRRQFTQGINQLFNAYRKEITGAAASTRELEDLKKAMLSEDLSPIEFEAAFNEFKSELKRSNRLTRRILREGIKGDFGKNLDKLFVAGEDDDVESRGMELRDQGLSDEEITERLLNEGF